MAGEPEAEAGARGQGCLALRQVECSRTCSNWAEAGCAGGLQRVGHGKAASPGPGRAPQIPPVRSSGYAPLARPSPKLDAGVVPHEANEAARVGAVVQPRAAVLDVHLLHHLLAAGAQGQRRGKDKHKRGVVLD